MNIDLARIADRVRAILTAPEATWRLIAAESETVESLYRNYITVLAAIPPVFGFIKACLLGFGAPFGISVRVSVGQGLGAMLMSYVLTLLAVFGSALVIEALAVNFDGRRDRVQSLKLAAYAFTAAFVAGAAVIVPGIGGVVYLAGVLYSCYLLYVGAQLVLAMPADKALPFTAICAAAGVALNIAAAHLAARLSGSLLPLGSYTLWT